MAKVRVRMSTLARSESADTDRPVLTRVIFADGTKEESTWTPESAKKGLDSLGRVFTAAAERLDAERELRDAARDFEPGGEGGVS